jgi:hypothetical protein
LRFQYCTNIERIVPGSCTVPQLCPRQRCMTGQVLLGGNEWQHMCLQNAMDGVHSLDAAGDVLKLHDRRIDHVSTSSTCCDMVTGTLRGNVSMWPRWLFFEKASEAGIMERSYSIEPSSSRGQDHGGSHGEPIFRVTTQRVRCLGHSVLLSSPMVLFWFRLAPVVAGWSSCGWLPI